MPTSIDSLQIEINAKATKANDAIETLIIKLGRLTTSLSKINGTNLVGLANGVDRLGRAMQTMNTVKTADFTRLARNLERMGAVNTASLNNVASSMSHLTRAFNNLGTVSANAQQVGVLASNLSKLGSASMQRAVTNMPLLATELNNLMTTLSKTPRVSNNLIQMTNALANLASQGNRINAATNAMNTGIRSTYTPMTRARTHTFNLASAIGMLYAKYFLVLRAIKLFNKALTSTADYIEAYNYMNVALGKISADWSHEYKEYGYESADAYAESFSTRLNDKLKKMSGLNIEVDADGNGLLTETGMKNLGLNIKEVTQYASQLAAVTNSVGQTGEASLATSTALTRLGADMSSLYNLDYSQVMGNLQSGLIGQSRALYKYGIDITNASLQTKAYELGITKAVSEMSQMEKQQLRVIKILEDSRISWGDLANTIDSPSNMIRVFKNNLAETGMVLGQLFTPALQGILPVLNGVTIAIKRLLTNLAGLMGIKLEFQDYAEGFTETEDAFDGLTEGTESATEALKEYKNQALDFDEINPLKDTNVSAGDTSVGGGAIDLTDEIIDATKEYEKVWNEAYDRMESKSQDIADRIVAGFKKAFEKEGWFGVGNLISSSLTDELESIDWDETYKSFGNLGTNIASFINGLFTPEVFSAVGGTIAGSLNSAINFYFSLGSELDFKQVGEAIGTGVNDFFKNFDFKKLGEGINIWVQGLADALIKAIKEIEWTDVISGFSDLVMELDTDTMAVLLSLGILRRGGLGGLGSAYGAGGLGLSGLLFGTGAGGLTIGNAGILGTLAAGLGAGTIGTEIGRVLGYLFTGDADLYLNYNVKDAFLEIANAIVYEPEEIKNAFINVVEDVAHWIDDTTYDITKPAFEKLDDIFWFSAKHEEDWKDLAKAIFGEPIKNAAQSETYRQMAEGETPTPELNHWEAASKWVVGDLSPYIEGLDNIFWFSAKHEEDWATLGESIDYGLSKLFGLNTKKMDFEDLPLVDELLSAHGLTIDDIKKNPTWQDYLPENQGWRSFLPGEEELTGWKKVYQDTIGNLTTKIEVNWALGGRNVDFLGIGEEMKKQGASIAWNIGQGVLNDKSAKSAISMLASSMKTVLSGKSDSIISFAKSFGSSVVSSLSIGLSQNETAKSAIGNVTSAILSSLGDKGIIETAISKGKSIVWNLGQGLLGGKQMATTPLQTIINSLKSTLSSNDMFNAFKSAGGYIIDGLIAGLKDNKKTSTLAKTVESIGGVVSSAFTSFMDINSPSGLFMEYGKYTVDGFNLGIQKYAPNTSDIMTDWSNSIASADMTYNNTTNISSSRDEEIMLLRQQNQLLQALLNKDTNVEIKADSKGLFKAVQKRANEYTIQTGQPAFSF